MKSRIHDLVAAMAEVTGVGITRIGEGYGVKVNLRSAPASDVRIPDSFEGVPIWLEVVGTSKKQVD